MGEEKGREKAPDSLLVVFLKNLVAGTVGGAALCLTGHPFDTLKVRLQTQSRTQPLYSGLVDCFRKTIAWEGYSGLYKGVMSPLLGQMAMNSVQFGAYSQAKALLCPQGQEMTVPQFFQAGLITGFAISFVEGPVDLLKSQMQVQIFRERLNANSKPLYTSVFDCGTKIFRQHGVRGVYQGLGATFLRDIPATSCYFGFYEWTKRALTPKGEAPTNSVLLTAGGAAGIMYWLFTYPTDVIKSSMQADATDPSQRRFKSIVHCARELHKEGGLKRFYTGFSPAMLRAVPANASCFVMYEMTMKLMQ